MIYSIPKFLRRFSSFCLLSTALVSPAFAASLPELSPDEIARDVEARYDSRTGEREYVAQDFDPFENDPAIAGSAALRSVIADRTIIDGRIVRDGAFLDISTIYTTNSSDPYDVRGYQQAVFPSGEPVGVLQYNSETLDCSRDVREVTYDDGYYRGASYGLIAGIYRLYPRYRGHRHFGWTRGRGWNRGGYGHWRRSYRDGYRDGWRRRGHDGVDRPRRRPQDGDVVDRRRPGSGGTVDRPRRRTGDGTIDRPRRRTGDGGVDRPRRRPGTDRPTRPERENIRAKRTDNPVVYRRSPNLNAAVGRPHAETKRPKRRKTSEPVSRPRRSSETAPSRRATSRPAVSRPRPAARPTPSRRASAPKVNRPAVSRPAPQPKSQPAKPVNRPVSRPRVNRSVDKTFRAKNPRIDRNKQREFYPLVGGYTRTDVYVNSRCVKEETLTLHIPADRLDAARFDGLVVILLDSEGKDLPVFVPPNYVEGFRRATGQASVSYRNPNDDPYVIEPSSREPIIYGDPGTERRQGYPQGD